MIQLGAIQSKKRNIIIFINNAHILSVLEHKQLRRIIKHFNIGLELPQQIPIDRMNQNGPLLTSTNHQTELTTNHNAHNLPYMTSQNSTRARILFGLRRRQILIDNQTLLSIPDPNHDGRIARTSRHKTISILSHLRSTYTRHQIIMTEHDLNYLSRVRIEHSKAFIKESRRQNKLVIIRYNKIILIQLQLIVEILAQLSPMQRCIERQQLVHLNRQLLLHLRRLIGVYWILKPL